MKRIRQGETDRGYQSNTRGMPLLLISTVTTAAVFKPAVVIATAAQSDIHCCVRRLSCDRYEQLTAAAAAMAAACVCVHSPIPLEACFTLRVNIVRSSTRSHKLCFTSCDEESAAQLVQLVADEGDATDQEEASS